MEETKRYWYFGEKYRVYRLDEYNVCIDEKVVVTNKVKNEQREEWARKGYWSSLEMALQALKKYVVNELIDNCDNNLESIVNYLKRFEVGVERKE